MLQHTDWLPWATQREFPSNNSVKVIVAERVIQAILEETLKYPDIETGQSLLGLENGTTIMVLGTIPDPSAIERSEGSLHLGGEDQAQIFRWYHTHWEELRERSRNYSGRQIPGLKMDLLPSELDLPLAVFGDWHKHPRGMNFPSWTDTNQLYQILTDPEQQRTQVLAPIAIYQRKKFLYGFKGSEVITGYTGGGGGEVRINWFYAHRDSPHQVYLVKPEIFPDGQLPWIPPQPWHLINRELLRQELTPLIGGKYQLQIGTENRGNDPIKKICIAVDRPEWTKSLLLVTDWDYPKSNPQVEIIQKEPLPPTENGRKAGYSIMHFLNLTPALNWLFPKEDSDPSGLRQFQLVKLVKAYEKRLKNVG